MMHGVGSDRHEMDTLARLMASEHPGTVATTLPLYENDASFLTPLKTQVNGVAKAIRSMVAGNQSLYANGYNLVCKSQGGLICRCVLEAMDDHNVDTFISLAGPQMGVYGADFFASLPGHLFPNVTADSMYLVAYTRLAQDTISDANMWHDPNHLSDFFKYDKFLSGYTYNATAAMKTNFLRLKKAVFCVGSGAEYDGGIEPWQSGVWGFYADGDAKTYVGMEEQAIYQQDTFGLKTLDRTGRLNLTVAPGVRHGDWTGNEDVIKTHVLPHLF
jgi:palmitoyl-protein thioesterase